MWSQVMMRHVWKRIVLQCGKTAHDYILKEAQRMNIGLPASFSSEFWQVVLEVSEARPQIPVDISWINKVIHDVWKPLDPFLHGLFQNRILPEFLSNLRASFTGMGIETCTLGSTPPQVRKVRVTPQRRMNEVPRQWFNIQFEIEWICDANINFLFPHVSTKLVAQRFALATEIHVRLLDFSDEPPFVGGVALRAIVFSTCFS